MLEATEAAMVEMAGSMVVVVARATHTYSNDMHPRDVELLSAGRCLAVHS